MSVPSTATSPATGSVSSTAQQPAAGSSATVGQVAGIVSMLGGQSRAPGASPAIGTPAPAATPTNNTSIRGDVTQTASSEAKGESASKGGKVGASHRNATNTGGNIVINTGDAAAPQTAASVGASIPAWVWIVIALVVLAGLIVAMVVL